VLRRTRAAMQELLDRAQREYPQAPRGPEDSWWLPAHLGGSAPTLEQAAAVDHLDARGHHVHLPHPHPVARLRRLVAGRGQGRGRGRDAAEPPAA
jgi:hypothetical protein